MIGAHGLVDGLEIDRVLPVGRPGSGGAFASLRDHLDDGLRREETGQLADSVGPQLFAAAAHEGIPPGRVQLADGVAREIDDIFVRRSPRARGAGHWPRPPFRAGQAWRSTSPETRIPASSEQVRLLLGFISTPSRLWRVKDDW